jgi:hypothetical protein
MNLFVPDVFHNLQKTGQPSPAAMDMIKLVALLAMLIDHINTLFLTPAWPVMYALGRMAFPLFTLIWAMNVQRLPERLQGKPAVDLGSHHAAGIQPGLPGSPAVVGDEHPVRVRRRHAAACPAVPVWPEGKPCRWSASALMIFPLQPASYGLSSYAVSLATVTGSSAPK